MILETTLVCPLCRAGHRAAMPLDACVFFYRCPRCRETVTPRAGDCCVFCSYGPDP